MTGGTRMVFVIDDDASVRTALLRLLRSAGYEAEGLDTATAYLQRPPPSCSASCLVLDVRMPGMTGLELQQRICGTPHALPIVFITGHGDREARRQALEHGAVAVLQKPLEEAVLLEAIERALGRGPLEGKGSVGR